MGVAYFIVVEGESSQPTTLDGKALANESRNIERLADEHGLRTLDDFFSLSAEEAIESMAEILGVEVEDLSEDDIAAAKKGAANNWFDPAEGLAFCGRLTELIQEDPTRVGNPEAVLLDLEAMKHDMAALHSEKKRWRFAIDF